MVMVEVVVVPNKDYLISLLYRSATACPFIRGTPNFGVNCRRGPVCGA